MTTPNTKSKNRFMLIALLTLVVLLFAVTIIKIKMQ